MIGICCLVDLLICSFVIFFCMFVIMYLILSSVNFFNLVHVQQIQSLESR